MKYILLIIAFTLAQALVFSRIHIFGVVTPLVYVYYVLLFPRNYPKWLSMVLCFIMGLSVDMFTNTPGLAASAMTFVGMLQPYLLELYLKKEDDNNFLPSIAAMGFTRYLTYACILLLIYCIVFFSLDAFALRHWVEWLESVFGSFLITLLLILTIDSTRKG